MDCSILFEDCKIFSSDYRSKHLIIGEYPGYLPSLRAVKISPLWLLRLGIMLSSTFPNKIVRKLTFPWEHLSHRKDSLNALNEWSHQVSSRLRKMKRFMSWTPNPRGISNWEVQTDISTCHTFQMMSVVSLHAVIGGFSYEIHPLLKPVHVPPCWIISP